jgi:DNA-binding NarL/FixJ family response regulator
MAISIVLADDHHLVRQALRTLLETQADFHIVGEAGDGLEAVRLVEQTQPTVLVADLMMPGINGLEVARQVRQRVPTTAIVILSMYAHEAYVLEALRGGVLAYVLKESTSEELVHAIREAAAGRRFLGSPLSEQSIDVYMRRAADEEVFNPYETLTTREREILHLAAEGLSSTAIAERLSISPRTSETHRTNLMRKLGLHSQTELVQYAVREGILRLQ